MKIKKLKKDHWKGFLVGTLMSSLIFLPYNTLVRSKIKSLEIGLNKPKIIREYWDLDKNGEYGSYKLVHQYNDGKEIIIPDSIGSDIRHLRFQTPFGGEIYEAPRELLSVIFTDYNYPNVDKIRFKH